MTLYLLCGMALAGKSTLAAAIAEHADATVISLDDINEARGLAGGSGIPDHEWAHSHRIALQQASEEIARGRSVVIDDTNCFRFLRDDYRALARRLGIRAVVLHLSASETLLRRRLRDTQATADRPPVLEQVFDELQRKFEPPTPDEEAVLVPAGADASGWVIHNIPPGKPRRVG